MNVEEWKPLVVKNAAWFRFKNPHLDFDDLVQEGWLGVLDALDRFDPAKSAALEIFVNYRIRSRMMDWAREQGLKWPVSGSRKLKRYSVAVEIPEAFPVADPKAAQGIAAVEAKATTDKLLKDAPDRGKQTAEMYYSEGQFMHEIGKRFNRSEAWASLIVGKTIEHARRRISA